MGERFEDSGNLDDAFSTSPPSIDAVPMIGCSPQIDDVAHHSDIPSVNPAEPTDDASPAGCAPLANKNNAITIIEVAESHSAADVQSHDVPPPLPPRKYRMKKTSNQSESSTDESSVRLPGDTGQSQCSASCDAMVTPEGSCTASGGKPSSSGGSSLLSGLPTREKQASFNSMEAFSGSPEHSSQKKIRTGSGNEAAVHSEMEQSDMAIDAATVEVTEAEVDITMEHAAGEDDVASHTIGNTGEQQNTSLDDEVHLEDDVNLDQSEPHLQYVAELAQSQPIGAHIVVTAQTFSQESSSPVVNNRPHICLPVMPAMHSSTSSQTPPADDIPPSTIASASCPQPVAQATTGSLDPDCGALFNEATDDANVLLVCQSEELTSEDSHDGVSHISSHCSLPGISVRHGSSSESSAGPSQSKVEYLLARDIALDARQLSAEEVEQHVPGTTDPELQSRLLQHSMITDSPPPTPPPRDRVERIVPLPSGRPPAPPPRDQSSMSTPSPSIPVAHPTVTKTPMVPPMPPPRDSSSMSPQGQQSDSQQIRTPPAGRSREAWRRAQQTGSNNRFILL